MDAAGAYKIQGVFSLFINRINGDYYNVVGLPVGSIYDSLKELGLLCLK
jgi:septum formation protein